MARHINNETGEVIEDAARRAASVLRHLAQPFPPAQLGRRGQHQYVPIRAVQDRLDAATHGDWSWSLHGPGQWVETKQRRGREGSAVVRAYVTTGSLCIPGLGCKDGRGVQDLEEGRDGQGISTSNIILGADSRALRNAAERMGMWKPGDDE